MPTMAPPPQQQDDDEEYDFDDPRFVLEPLPTTSSAPLSYAAKRKLDIQRGLDKGRTHAPSRQQREREAREEGLAQNLLTKAVGEEGESTALKMMRKMGYAPGESMGKRVEPVLPPSGSGLGSTAGIGSKRPLSPPPNPAPASKPRTEPLQFHLRTGKSSISLSMLSLTRRTGRKGLGPTPVQPARPVPKDPATPLPDLGIYLSQQQDSFSLRHSLGILRAVRRTCEELDRRAGMEDSVMWKEEPSEGERRRERVRMAGIRGGDDEEVVRERLEYEKGLSETVVELEDEEGEFEKSEEEEWFGLEPTRRLSIILDYLRKTYFYCFFCGCSYDDATDLSTSCPGESEGDH